MTALKLGSLKRVLSVFQNLNSPGGFTLAKITEAICQKYNKGMTKSVRAKIMKSIMKGMKKKIIAEDSGKFRLMNNGMGKKPVTKVSSVPSITQGASSAGRLHESKSLMSTSGDRRVVIKKKRINNIVDRKTARKPNNGVKNGANRGAGRREFTSADIDVALMAIIQVREDNERLIQECKNVNKSLKQRYNMLKRLNRTGTRDQGTHLRTAQTTEIKKFRRKRNVKREWTMPKNNNINNNDLGLGLTSYVYDSSNTNINKIPPPKENYGENTNKETVQLE